MAPPHLICYPPGMADTHSFGAVLARVRRDRGFPNPHAFYKNRDGRRNLQLTFRSYLDIEQGKSLPKPERLKAILHALDLTGHALEAQELVESYFESLGLNPLMPFLSAKEASSKAPELGELAARQAVAGKSMHLTTEQWKLRADDFDANACLLYLITTPGGCEVAELAETTGIGSAAAKRAVKALASVGLAKAAGSRVRTPLDDKLVKAPPRSPAMVGVMAALEKHRARMIEKGRLVQNSAITLRLTEAHLKHFQRHLDELIDMAYLYESQEKKSDIPVYMIWGRIFQLFPVRRGKTKPAA